MPSHAMLWGTHEQSRNHPDSPWALALVGCVRLSLRREGLRQKKPGNRLGDKLEPGPSQPRVSLGEAGMDPQAVEAAVSYAATRNTRALVVGRGGHIVFEKYWDGTSPTPRWSSRLRAGAGGDCCWHGAE